MDDAAARDLVGRSMALGLSTRLHALTRDGESPESGVSVEWELWISLSNAKPALIRQALEAAESLEPRDCRLDSDGWLRVF